MNHCTNHCQQGRKPCPTPQACFLPDSELEPKIDWAFVAYNIILILVCIGMVIYTVLTK